MNLGQLRTQTRYYLDDNSAARWDDTEVNSYINQAYRNYYNQLVEKCYDGLLPTPVLLNMVSGVNTIALPTDFFQGQILYRVLSDRKTACPYKQNFDNTILLTYTSNYFVPNYSFEGMQLLLDPTPNDSETGAFELHYWPVMTELSSDSDSPVAGFSVQWHDLLPLWAAYQAKSLREEEDVANIMQMLSVREQPFRDKLDTMTTARVRTEIFNTENYIY